MDHIYEIIYADVLNIYDLVLEKSHKDLSCHRKTNNLEIHSERRINTEYYKSM